MSLLQVNTVPVLKGTLSLPRVGAWHADFIINADTTIPVGTSVTVATDDSSLSLKGTVYFAGTFTGSVGVRIIGGANGLTKVLPSKAYHQVPISLPVNDIMRECGETLNTSTSISLSGNIAFWTRTQDTALNSLQRLLTKLQVSWRILPNGSIQLANDTYPAAPTTQFDLLSFHRAEKRIEIGSTRPFLMPGTLWTLPTLNESFQVSYVTHNIEYDTLRTEVWAEP